jgi:hypothetical protein
MLSVDVTHHFLVKDKIVSETKDFLLQAHVGNEDKDANIFNVYKRLILGR